MLMNQYQTELADNLSVLLADDPALREEVISDFVYMLGDSDRMHALHEFTTTELQRDYL
jgi:hypothetical protein